MSTEYVIMLLYCLLIVLVILIKAFFDKNISVYSRRLLLIALISESVMLTAEAIGTLMSLGKINVPNYVNAIDQFIFFLAEGITHYITFLLLADITGYIKREDMLKRNLYCIPETILTILAFISIWTGWIFYIDSNGVYQRGPINFVHYVIAGFYIAFAGVPALIRIFMKKYYAQRSLHISIVFYSLLPLAGTILQLGVKEARGDVYPLILSSITLSTLIIYLQLLQNQVQTDSLTEIPNRAKLMRYIESKMNHNDKLCIFLLDVNHFKYINDTYGHIAGDKVLKVLSDSLKEFSKKTGNFVARYAGDEFMVVGEIEREEIENVEALIKDYISKANSEINDDRYELTVAVGYAYYDESIKTIIDFINKADAEMYKDKEKYHNENA